MLVAVLIATFVAVFSPLSAQADTPATWGNATLVTPNIGTWRFIDQSNGTTLMVWVEVTGIFGSTSTNDGQTWSQPALITSQNPSTFSGLDMTAIPNGGFAIVVSDWQGNLIRLLKSNASGTAWSLVGSQTVTQPDSLSIAPVGIDRVAISAEIRISGNAVTNVSISDAGINSLPTFTPVSTLSSNSYEPQIVSSQGIITSIWGMQSGQLGSRTSADFGATWGSVSLTNTGLASLSQIQLLPCAGQFVATLFDGTSPTAIKLMATPISATPSWSIIISSPTSIYPSSFSTACSTDNKLVTAYASSLQVGAFWASSSLVSGSWTPSNYAVVPGSTANVVVLSSAARGQVALLSSDSVEFGTSSIYAQYFDPTNGWSTQILIQQSQDLPTSLVGTRTANGAIMSWSFMTNDGFSYTPDGNITSLTFTSATRTPAPTPSDELAKTGLSSGQNWFVLNSGLALFSLVMGLILLRKSTATRRKM